MGGLVFFFFVETLYFLMFLFFLLIPVCFSVTRATTQFTLITAHHDRIPSQPYGYFSDYWSFSHRAGPGSRMGTDVDLEVYPYVQPDTAPKSGYLRCRQAPLTLQVGRRQLSALLNTERLGSVTLAPAARPQDRERDRECVAYQFPASVRWSYPSASVSFSSTTAEQHNNTTRPDRQQQFQFVMSLGRFSVLPPACFSTLRERIVWNAWYPSVFSLNSDASWHPVICWRQMFPLSLEVLFHPVSPVRSQRIHDTSFPHREV